ncbi:hypothetical protein DYB38_013254 [Aphanomyces astaci]|uniref:Transposase Tc1-like domain-containing protein n=1 Tax=Aphanomyces astaci TaxID=112090 RepID=A0A397E5D7_APHAT|nr:hypothetical protein DYB38_013254 [Aphanomyces astaci]
MDSARARRELSDDNKLEVIHNLQCLLTFGKLPRGSIQATATRLGINRKTVSSIWNGFITQGSSPSKKAGRVGRKLHYTPDHVTQLVQAVPQEQRTTMRDISVATGLSLGTICRNLKAGTLQRRSSRLKPMLTDANRAERVGFCRSHVRRIAATSLAEAAATVTAFGGDSGYGSALVELPFSDMIDVVHLDEKWFNADKDRRKVYLTKGETPKGRACKSKRFIPKVMFLAAVARPQFDADGNLVFDGKIGMWPFITMTPAARSSRNRSAGTLVATLVNVNAAVYQDFVLNLVLPAIKAKMPSVCKRVMLQQDNATPHMSISDAVLQAVSHDEWIFTVQRQPPNSPDLNVLDLGFFASIQALQYKSVSRTVDDVIRTTLAAYDELSVEKLDNVFLTFQAVMRLVLEHNGGNQFRLPHMNKAAMRRAGTLMANVICPVSLLQ